MQPRINWSKITIKAIIAALLWSIVWSWLFSLMVKDEFVQVLPFGLGSGVIIGILLFFLMTVPYRIIAISVAFKDDAVFKKRLELAFSKIGYRPKSGKSWKYERPGLDSYFCENISVTIEGKESAIIVGPKSPVHKLQKILS